MKINEKIVSRYVQSGSPDREGYLFKKGEVNRAFQKRWFILRGNILCYFERKGDREPLGAVILEGCRVEVDDTDANLFCFKIAFAHRAYVLAAPTQQEMEDWVKIIARSSYEYLHLTVSELEKQLSEVKHSSGNQSFSTSSMIPMGFSGKTFAEIHHAYGVQFRDYFSSQRHKNSIGLLVDLS